MKCRVWCILHMFLWKVNIRTFCIHSHFYYQLHSFDFDVKQSTWNGYKDLNGLTHTVEFSLWSIWTVSSRAITCKCSTRWEPSLATVCEPAVQYQVMNKWQRSLWAVDSTCICLVYTPCWRNCSCCGHSPGYIWTVTYLFTLSGTV